MRRMLLALILCAAGALFDQPLDAGERGTILREVTSQHSQTLSFFYEFPGPLRSAEIKLFYSNYRNSWDKGVINFGNGKTIALPGTLVACFPDLRPELLDLLYEAVDASFPNANDYWWSSVIIPFGQKMRSVGQRDPVVTVHVYPYVEFEISKWILSRVDIRRSPTETRVISISSQSCPNKDISWALER